MPNLINDVRPFRAEHYNAEKVGDWGACLSKPYDVISPAQQEAYYQLHPNNVIRLILNRIEPADHDGDNRYCRARDLIHQWRQTGIIKSTTRPSFWAYTQEFDLPDAGRKKVSGFIGLVRLQDYAERRILPHEKVIRDPLADRIRLTRTTRTQFEYIWSFYPEAGHIIDGILRTYEDRPSILDYAEETTYVQHKLWRVVEPETCTAIQQAMSSQKIYIADGHHRYQTMLSIRDEMRRLHPDAGLDAPWEFIMMFLVNAEHAGLVSLPSHRMLCDLPITNWETVAATLASRFRWTSYPYQAENEPAVRQQWLSDLRQPAPGEHKLGTNFAGLSSYYVLTVTDAEALQTLGRFEGSETLNLLDVSLLNNLVLKPMFSIVDESHGLQHVKYTPHLSQALEAVRSGEMQAVWVLNPTRVKDVMTVANHDERMPPKSTYFYPKPLSGLVFYNLDSGH